jgi:hypothetical protein
LAIAVHRTDRRLIDRGDGPPCHGHGHCRNGDMNLTPPKLSAPLRRGVRRGAPAPDAASAEDPGPAQPVREPEDDMRRGAEPPEPSWRASSYDLKHGLDVVDLPTTLPVDVLDRLFNAPGK